MIKILSCKCYCFGTKFEKKLWPNIFIWLLDNGALKRFQVYPSPLYLSDMRYANTSRKLLKLRPFEFCLVYFKTLKVQRFIKFQSFFLSCIPIMYSWDQNVWHGWPVYEDPSLSFSVCQKEPRGKGWFHLHLFELPFMF